MRQGKPLNDDLRLPWLLSIHKKLKSWDDQKLNGVFACSALKQKYRNVLSTGLDFEDVSTVKSLELKFILLNCDMDLIKARLENRNNHEIIKKETVSNIIKTQFETIELPSKLNSVWTCSQDERNFLVKECDAHFIYILNCDSNSSINAIVINIIQFLNLIFKENYQI
jgi:carbohydrate kinase (thermoresistant glucokinase family)